MNSEVRERLICEIIREEAKRHDFEVKIDAPDEVSATVFARIGIWAHDPLPGVVKKGAAFAGCGYVSMMTMAFMHETSQWWLSAMLVWVLGVAMMLHPKIFVTRRPNESEFKRAIDRRVRRELHGEVEGEWAWKFPANN